MSARVAKALGGDVELGNSILGMPVSRRSASAAAHALLREIPGARATVSWIGQSAFGIGDPQDWGRRFLPNGSSFYIDLGHLEAASSETLSARDHVAAWHANLRIARGAAKLANARLPIGQKLRVTANNSDGLGHSWGAHLNVAIARETWDALFDRQLHLLLFLASFLSSSVVISGAGKVGAESGDPVRYQLGRRPDFLETIVGSQTTYNRPIVNSRDESLCTGSFDSSDASDRVARLHVIAMDSVLMPMASFLRAGTLQLVVALIEDGVAPVDLILADPVDAVRRWSRDPDLRARARLLTGRSYTAVEMQEATFELAARFVASGRAEHVVPEAERILSEWGRTLGLLRQRDIPALARRLDWAAKLKLLEGVRAEHGLDWEDPGMKVLDQAWADLDPEDGLYFAACEGSGQVDRVVSEERIRELQENPPEDTRAWLRGRLLDLATPAEMDGVDWYRIRFRTRQGGRFERWIVDLSDPMRGTKEECGEILAGVETLRDALVALDGFARRERPKMLPVAGRGNGGGYNVRT